MKWCKVKYKLRDFWYWLAWFFRSRGGRRLKARQVQMPLFEIVSCPEIKLSEIKARRFDLVERKRKPDGCLEVFEDEWLDAKTQENN
jgi:hypothetical protein